MYLCSKQGRFLYEARPDIFPEGRLTSTETELWGFFYEELNESMESMRRSHHG